MQRILFILTAALCVLTACGPEAEKPPEPGRARAHIESLRPATGTSSLSVSDTSIDFGDQPACAPQQDSIKLFNTGSTALTIHRVTTTGGFTFNGLYDTAANRCDTNCSVPPTPVSSPEAMTVQVAFTPNQPGTFHGTLTLHTNDPAAPSITVELEGKASGPLIIVGQTSVDFGAHELGTYTPRSLTVMNLGNEEFRMVPSTTAPFIVGSDTWFIQPASSVAIPLNFGPMSIEDLGSITRALFLTSASTVCPAPPSVLLTGVGLSPAKIGVSRTAVAFGETPVNTDTAIQEVIVRNDGDGLLTVTQVKLPASSPFRVDITGSFSLAKGDTQRLKLAFRPTVPGNWTHNLSFTIGGTDVPGVTLTGSTPAVVPPKLGLSRATLTFEQTPVNAESAIQEVTVRNDGGGVLTVTQVKLPANSPFHVDTSGPFSLASGDTQRLKLTFRPTETGSWNETLAFTIDGTDVPGVSLSGATPAVILPKLVLSLNAMVFPQTPLDTDSAPQELTVWNEGGSALNVSQLVLTQNSFFRVDTAAPFSIAPGGTQRLKVTFRPRPSGTPSDTLVFKSNVADQSVTLSGSIPSSPKLVLSRTEMAFEQTPFDTDSAPQEVTVKNGGDSLLTVTQLALPQDSPFRVDPSGPFNLAPGNTQRLQLTFRPTQTSATAGKLTFTSNDPAAPELSLSGTKTPGNVCLGISPLSFEFAEQEAGDVGSEQKKVTVTNTGTVALTVTPAVTGSSAYSVSPTTSFTLAPGSAGRELFVTFNPGANESGAVEGVLTFGTSPTTSCVSNVPLRGTARKTSLGVSTTTLSFSDYTVGAPPLTQQVILSNNSNWPIKVFAVSPGILDPFTVSGIPAEGLTVQKNGGTAPVTVTFAATTSGNYSKTLQLQTDASQAVPSVTITGRALAPELTLVTNPLVMPNVAPGGESTKEATLRNSGNQALFLSKVIPEDNNTLFQVVDFPPQTLQPGGETKVKVLFRPMTSTGDLEARLRFYTTNDQRLPPVLVVKGNSNGPNAVFTASEINFGHKQIRSTHVNLSLNVSNSSSATEPLKVTDVHIEPSGTAFSVDNVTSSEPVLEKGAKRPQPFRVTFSPNIEDQEYEASLEITYRGTLSNIETKRSFRLKGTGAEAKFSTSLATVDFPATQPGGSLMLPVDIINTGKVEVELAEVATSVGTFNIDLIGGSNSAIPVGGRRRIEITFVPQRPGNYFGDLELATKTPATASLKVKLSGVAAVAQLQLNKNQLVFNDIPRLSSSTQTVTLSNIGSAPLTITNATGSGPFTARLQNNQQFPVTIEKNAPVQLDVTFRPESALEVTGTVHVLSNSNESTDQIITVSGRGTIPVLTLPGGAPEFAPQAITVEGDPQPVVVTNTGKAPLVVYSVSVPDQFCIRADTQKTAVCPSTLSPVVPAFTVEPGTPHAFYVTAKPTQLLKIERNLVISSNADPSSTVVKLIVDGVGGVSLSPSTIDFGRVNFGSSLEKTVTVTNTGITDANISVTIPAGNSEFSVQETLPKVPANGSATVKLRFTPQGSTGGLRTAKATVRVEASSQLPQELPLQGTATLARLAVARRDGQAFEGALDFGGTRVNTTSDGIGLRLTHVGPKGSADAGSGAEASTLTVKEISLDAEDARAFILQKPNLPLALPPDGSLDMSLQFRPDAQRRFNAILRITSEDSQTSTMLVTLGGQGRTSQLSLSTPTLEFGARVAESSASAIRFVRLTNESLQPLVVRGLEIIAAAENSEPSHFSLDSAPTLPLTLAAQESRDVFVKYVPRPDVTSKANLLVVTNDLESPEAQVSLSGRGLSTVFRALNRSLDFGTVRQAEAATAKVVLTNDTTQELVLMPPKVEGPQAASFVVVSPVVGAEGRTLPQGDSLTLDLKFDTSVIGAAKATLVLSTKDLERAALVTLSGVSVASFLTIEPMELDLGWVDIGATSTPRTVTLTNQSASPARLSVVSNSNPAFEIDASALDAELAPGAQTTVGVTFRGEVGGPAEGTLKLRLRGETTTEASLTLKAQARTLGGTGGGCACGTSGDGGAALALLLLLGLGLARQTRRARAED
ncbi:choice-of-anchor D domain-containing protein [Corallococcus aberystwythensis]|uniref:Choice-of-anchor D domain-containing protein n=1 Tax=Corallococcus aberystwythensis TaxID=2316722 RepID=A0A3A8PBS4_9BACT|nr:choice-of-anchor D domain-containing protein [Corallococcus aberystwythensis]RKH53773.1 choice-of-anchor D domain-containing protein [Corallococcus aberystwythensis]